MAKKFFTERDIEDMAARGEYTLTVCQDVVLTELAFEKAERLGIKLIQPHQTPPSAPIRPYLAEKHKQAIEQLPQVSSQVEAADDSDLRHRIRSAVKAKLGNQMDDVLLDTIITRVLNNTGIAK